MKHKTEGKIEKIMKQIGEAHKKHRKWELTLKTCPKCQFEAVEKGRCNHCGYEY